MDHLIANFNNLPKMEYYIDFAKMNSDIAFY